MKVAVIGVNHNKAPIEIREKVSFSESKKIEATDKILDMGIKEVVILSTCNRSEIYIVSDNKTIDSKIEKIKNFYVDYFKQEEIRNYLFAKKGLDSIYHIYNVSCGLDSIVLGEDQILGQVKDSIIFAMETGGSSKILNKLFREAVTTSKKVKTKLKISQNPLSISYIGIKYLKKKLKSFENKKVLIIGAGHMSKLALNHIMEENISKIYMANRSKKNLLELIFDYENIEIVGFEKRYELLEDIDILICATGAPHTIIKKEDMKNIKKELYIMDIALPRDVEDEVGELENINLYTIDDLKELSKESMKRREELSIKAKEMIKEDVDEFLIWAKNIKVDRTIKSLNQKCNIIKIDTVDYIDKKLKLSCKDKKIVDKMINSALKRLIREPVLKLKDIKDEEKKKLYMKVLDELFEF
ncbi:MAG: glutamyl-tRNA reductase [Peptostreptococcaceae bacterium]|jgi:glutamyl-tRNA reductase|nr:glutamyl-tRNA reductase [Peptostreptococcaceae bacterium]